MATQRYSDEWLEVWEGDNRTALAQMPEQSVHAVITSPPYYGLRDYGLPPSVWGGDAGHAHEWGPTIPGDNRGGSGTPTDKNNRGEGYGRDAARGNFCACGAWSGCLGLEPSPELYVEHLVDVFRAVWRVLRDDGVLWLNLGDSYVSTAPGTKNAPMTKGSADAPEQWANVRPRTPPGMKPKDLMGVPWMAAFALRADGWYLRSDVVWNKPNAMPESVEDRPARSHESIFLLTKSARYFYDHLAVKEPASEATIKAVTARMKDPIEDKEYQHDSETRMGKRSPNRVWSDPEAMKRLLAGRNLRDVWSIPTVSYPGAHYATFPPKLVEPMLKASTSERGVCSTCGQPLVRETVPMAPDEGLDVETLGWATPCGHEGIPVPATVLDPFGGSGTVAKVAQLFSRRAILIDLNAEYIDQQMVRNAQVGLGL